MSKWIYIPDSSLALKSYSHGFMVGKVAKCKPTKSCPDGTTVTEVSYCSTLVTACHELLERKVRDGTYKTLNELVRAHKVAIKWIEDKIQGMPGEDTDESND